MLNDHSPFHTLGVTQYYFIIPHPQGWILGMDQTAHEATAEFMRNREGYVEIFEPIVPGTVWYDWATETVQPRKENPTVYENGILSGMPIGSTVWLGGVDYVIEEETEIEVSFDSPGPNKIQIFGLAEYYEKEITVP